MNLCHLQFSTLICFLSLFPFTAKGDIVQIEVDGRKLTGRIFPKDFLGVYQTPLYPLDTILKSIPLLKELGIKNIRYELGWGKPDAIGWQAISGSLARLKCDFSFLNPLLKSLRENGVQPLFAITYCPKPLQVREGWEAWKDPPSSLKAWSYICYKFAEYVKSFQLKPIYEIWNEPDLGHNDWKDFFYGDPETYRDVYKEAVKGILKADESAIVGGAGVAWNQAYNQAILRSGERVDFISVHAYGPEALQRHIDWAMGVLAQEGKQLPIFLTEYSSFQEFGLHSPVSRYPAASAFFRDLQVMLAYYPRLRKIYWAQWVDDALGLLTKDLHRKAIYNAIYIYQRLLPQKECSAEVKGEGIGVLAGRDERTIGIVVWNEKEERKRVQVRLENCQSQEGKLLVYRIDANHSSFLDNSASEKLEPTEEKVVKVRSIVWEGEIQPLGVLLLQMNFNR